MLDTSRNLEPYDHRSGSQHTAWRKAGRKGADGQRIKLSAFWWVGRILGIHSCMKFIDQSITYVFDRNTLFKNVYRPESKCKENAGLRYFIIAQLLAPGCTCIVQDATLKFSPSRHLSDVCFSLPQRNIFMSVFLLCFVSCTRTTGQTLIRKG